jgi:hypothetical protein
VQLASRAYIIGGDATESSPLTSEDVLDFKPVTKFGGVVSQDAETYMFQGSELVRLGDFQLATQYFTEAVQTAQQVVGYSDPLVARAHQELAMCTLRVVVFEATQKETDDEDLESTSETSDSESGGSSNGAAAAKASETGDGSDPPASDAVAKTDIAAEEESAEMAEKKALRRERTLQERRALRFRRWLDDLLHAVDLCKRSCVLFDQLKGPDDPSTHDAYESLVVLEQHAMLFSQTVLKHLRLARAAELRLDPDAPALSLDRKEEEDELIVESSLLQRDLLGHARRCLDIMLVLSGESSLASARIMLQFSNYLLDQGLADDCLAATSNLRGTAQRYPDLLGSLFHLRGLAYASKQDFRNALESEKDNFKALKSVDDGSDFWKEKIAECENYLQHYTKQAVFVQRISAVDTPQIQPSALAMNGSRANGKHTKPKTSAAPKLPAKKSVKGPAPTPDAPLDELVAFINGQ